MKKMILVIDESGAKGKAKTHEKYEKELGVMSGFLYRPDEIEYFDSKMDEIIQPFKKNIKDKFHITSLNKEEQSKIRDDAFNFMKQEKIQWFYYAIFAEGFHQSEFNKNRQSKPTPLLSLHATLFNLMLVQSLCMINSIAPNEDINLLIITDPIDKGVLKLMKKEVEPYISVLTNNPIKSHKYIRNENTGEIRKIIIKSTTSSASLPVLKSVNYSIQCKESPITILADILVNSTHHYLKKYALNGGTSLNDKSAIENHPVADLAVINDIHKHNTPNFADIIYRIE